MKALNDTIYRKLAVYGPTYKDSTVYVLHRPESMQTGGEMFTPVEMYVTFTDTNTLKMRAAYGEDTIGATKETLYVDHAWAKIEYPKPIKTAFDSVKPAELTTSIEAKPFKPNYPNKVVMTTDLCPYDPILSGILFTLTTALTVKYIAQSYKDWFGLFNSIRSVVNG